jgi:hypothetical protein
LLIVVYEMMQLQNTRLASSLFVGISHRRLKKSALKSAAEPQEFVSIDFVTKKGDQQVVIERGKLIRDVMLERDVELYTPWGIVWNCNGNGNCGLCVVEV